MTTLVAIAMLCRPSPELSASTKGQIDLRKGTVLVVAISPTCPHALKHKPTLAKLSRAVAPTAKLVAVMQEDLGAAAAFAKKTKASFPIVGDPKGTLVSGIGAEHTLDLGIFRNGKLLGTKVGLSRTTVKSLLESAGVRAPKNLGFLPAEVVSGCSL